MRHNLRARGNSAHGGAGSEEAASLQRVDFVELGAGVGHLINLSASYQFENPAKRGHGGLSLLLAGGGRVG